MSKAYMIQQSSQQFSTEIAGQKRKAESCRVQQQMQNYSKKLKNLHFGVSKFNFSLGLELSLYCTFLMYRSV